MSEGKEELGFVIGIRPVYDFEGKFLKYLVQAQNKGIQKEAVITMLRTLVRTYEDEYYRGFKAQ